ncbi:MAG: MgtC/SapB family protein [Acetivibrionales bacterium]|jgi:putative Mg2+ transporter-C (MgtC) family protein
MNFYVTILIRLLLAAVLGGIIGYEREQTNRPAGFRTHILVCVGAAVAMITSDYIFRTYPQNNIDPARLGAQVISGIGFLGAGTIIREGINVRGLTTAASLWAVACVGLAAGIGFYSGAVCAAGIIIITLIVLKKIESYLGRNKRWKVIYIKSVNREGQIGALSSIFEKYGIKIRTIEFANDKTEESLLVKFVLKMQNSKKNIVINELHGVEGVIEVSEE